MKATIVTMTQQLAKDYLSRNTQNRKVKERTLRFYKNQMTSGKWKENGEAIIIDTNGVIKDGQHRLMAVAQTGYAYRVPVISGINEDVMDTIDTGANRGASDVLYLEGFKYPSLIASLSKLVLNKSKTLTREQLKHLNISNSDILKFASENREYLYEICNNAMQISSLQVVKVLNPSFIAFFLYLYGNTENTIEFLKMITGTIRVPGSATDYVYKKLALSKSGDIRLSNKDKQLYIDKGYVKYTQGNPKVKSLKIKPLKSK